MRDAAPKYRRALTPEQVEIKRRDQELRAEAMRLERARLEAETPKPRRVDPAQPPLSLEEAIGIVSGIARGEGEPSAREVLTAVELVLKLQGIGVAPAKADAPDAALDAALEAFKAGPDGLR